MERSNALHEEIQRVAHELYVKRGMSDGSDLDDWLQAEKIVLESHSAAKGVKERPRSTRKQRSQKANEG